MSDLKYLVFKINRNLLLKKYAGRYFVFYIRLFKENNLYDAKITFFP